MLISRVLFATRTRRIVPPLLCMLLAVAAVALGGPLGLVVAVGLLLLAALFKSAAELTGRLSRLESQIDAVRRDVGAASRSLQSLESRVSASESQLQTLRSNTKDQQATNAARFKALERRDKDLLDQISRVIDGLKPIRRHRVLEGDTMPDLSLRSASESLVRRFKSPSTGGDPP